MTPQGEQQLMLDEGFRPRVYLDTKGNPTIGYGTRCRAGDFPYGVDQQTAKLLMEKQLLPNRKALDGFTWFSDLNGPRQDVIENMAYNMGISKLLTFKNMIRDVQCGMFNSAALEMLNSDWHSQVGPRAVRLAHVMASGSYPAGEAE